MGKKLVLTGVTLTDPDAPRLITIDPIESAGSLYLVDPSHPAGAWGAGMPSNGDSVPNLFAATLGIGNPTWFIAGGINNGVKGSIERSTLGGLHGIVSQAASLVQGDGATFRMPAGLKSYLDTHSDHTFYVSVWDRCTRTHAGLGSYTFIPYAWNTQSTNNGLAVCYVTGWGVGTGATTVAQSGALGIALGPRYASAAVKDNTLNAASGAHSAGPLIGAAVETFNWNTSALSSMNTNHAWPSAVFYRCYIEDLTVSGRSFADVHAIDHALYTKEVLTPGGRYYGDTFTDPATIP